MKKIGLVFLFLFILSANALATDYYVKTPANGGNNANDGLAWATAKATISAAMLLVNGSDNVHVAAGTYNERVSFHASDNNQLLGGYSAAGGGTRAPWSNPTIISGTGLTGSVIYIPGNFSTNRGYSGIVIDGMTVKNGSKSTAYGAGIESYSVGLTIKNCIVENNTSTGSGLVGGIYALALLNELSTRLLRIEACIIRNNTGPLAGAILIDAISPFQLQLVNNLIYGNSSSNTTFLFGVGGVAIGTGSQMMASPPNNPKIINCTIANNTAAHPTKKVGGIGVNLEFGETVTIANSIIWHPGAGVDDIYAHNGETTSISYSNVRDPADPGESGPGVIHSEPSFVGASDYRLNTGSPCIDTGSNTVSGIPSTDLEGNPRIADGDGNGTATVDMGAYEKTAPADTTPPTGSVVIHGASTAYTNNLSETLLLSATDASPPIQMCISNTNPNPATCPGSWEAFAATKNWTLSSGEGLKTVYVWYRDNLNNTNTTPYSDTITVDLTTPVDGRVTAATGNGQVTIEWSGFSDALSGIQNYKVVFDTAGMPANCSTGTTVYENTGSSFTHTSLTNGTTYYYRVCARDNAYNTSTGVTTIGTPNTLVGWEWSSIPGNTASPPSIAWNPVANETLLLVRASDNSIWTSTFGAGGAFNNDWISIPGMTISPMALAWNPVAQEMLVVVRAADDSIWVSTFHANGSFNNDWASIPGRTASPPAIAWNPSAGKMQMVVRAGDGSVWTASFSSANEFNNDWASIPGRTASPPAIAWNPSANEMQMVVRAGDNSMWVSTFDATGNFNNDWAPIPGMTVEPPALAWDVVETEVKMLVRAADDSMWLSSFDGTGAFLNNWASIPGRTASPPAMTWHYGVSYMQVVVRASDGSVWSMFY